MRDQKTVAGLVVLTLALTAVAGLTGCTSAKAEPLEVTYYYLPG
jgi:hypothetical protein